MPFQSENQRKFMWAKHPDIAKKWAHGQHSTKGSDHKMPFQAAAKRKLTKNSSAKGVDKKSGRH